MPASLLPGLLLAFATALVLGRLAIALAGRLRFLDHPGARKPQSRPIPMLGGAALILGLLAGLLPEAGVIAEAWRGPIPRWLLGGLWLAAVGLVDDRRGLGAGVRVVAQLVALLPLVPELLAWHALPWLGLPLGALWILGLTNALNFFDNMDGAAASAGFWPCLALARILADAGEPGLALPCALLAAGLLGFLVWNRPPARLYMGDAGSTFLGYSLAALTLLAVQSGALSPWLAPLLLGLPIYDTATVFWIRRREGRPLWVGDRRHATHRMLERGASVRLTLFVFNLWGMGLAALALLGNSPPLARHAPWLTLGAALLAWGCFVGERRRESAASP